MTTIGKKESFALEYEFYEIKGRKLTELAMYIKGKNILAFRKDNKEYTTCWELDEIVEWLRKFLDNLYEEPYPVEVNGEFAAQKDILAREVEIENDDEFDKYFDILDEWNSKHRWHASCSGAILSDVYFQLVDGMVEISWNNKDLDEDVEFVFMQGGEKVNKNEFYFVIDTFLKNYAEKWFV